ncbi:zinc finger protein interacting with ribonucleoprotein K-like isoform X2 [Ambystoma mexicanum]|uniref:zinc finger protein interacting with ribonucleoprotein K-like isoform X2 n=1 Tax=Ambystoma mexicanum TaxID=8296 RepID=UPI0037E950B1
MFRQHLGQAPLTFQDLAACFSEEEWKLLHEWQNELYMNVMKEIHQALISLGPLIATSVFSLRAKENEELCAKDNRDSERMSSSNDPLGNLNSSFHVSIGINGDGTQYLLKPQDTVRRDSSDGFSTGSLITASSCSLRTKENLDQCLGGKQDLKINHSVNPTKPEAPTQIISLIIKEEEDVEYMERQHSKRLGSSNNPTELNFLNIRPEPTFVDSLGVKGGETARSISGNGQIRKAVNDLKCNETTSSSKASPDKATSVFQGSGQQIYSRSQLWSESSPITHGQKHTQCEMGYKNSTLAVSYPRIPILHISDKTNENKSTLANTDHLPCQQNTNLNWTQFKCTVCKKSFKQNMHLVRHMRIHMGRRQYQCNECGKSFCQSGTLNRHRKIHTGEKPYHCTQCDKSFNQKGNLILHQRIH